MKFIILLYISAIKAYDDLCCQGDWRYECTNWQECFDMPQKCLDPQALKCLLKNCGACTGLSQMTPQCLECQDCTPFDECLKYSGCSNFPSKCLSYQRCRGSTIDCRSQDCEGEWGPWSDCSTTCGGGYQSSVFKVVKEKVGTGKDCEAYHGQVATQACQQLNECGKNEALNALGPNRCSEHAECDGKRTCSSHGFCQGHSGCEAAADENGDKIAEVELTGALASSNYAPHSTFKCCEASRALDDDPASFFHTVPGIGEWWKADFKEGPFTVTSVKIQNRASSEERLGGAEVLIDERLCGTLPEETTGVIEHMQEGKTYEVECEIPLRGSSVKVMMMKNEPLHFSEISVFGVEEIETSIRVYYYNGQGPNDGVHRSEMFTSFEEAEMSYDMLPGGWAKILLADFRVLKSFGEETEQGKCRLLAEKDGFLNPGSTYTKGRGRCRLANGRYNSDDSYDYRPGGVDPATAEECQKGCDEDIACTAFHYMQNPPLFVAACHIWTEPYYAPNGEAGVDCYVKNHELQEFVKVGEGILMSDENYFPIAQAKFPTSFTSTEMIEVLKQASAGDIASVGFYYLNEYGRFEGGLQYDADFFEQTKRTWPPDVPQFMLDYGITEWTVERKGEVDTLWGGSGDVTGASLEVSKGFNTWTSFAKTADQKIEEAHDPSKIFTCSKEVQKYTEASCTIRWAGVWQTLHVEKDGTLESVVFKLSNTSPSDYSFTLALKLAAKGRGYYNADKVETSKTATIASGMTDVEVTVPFEGNHILKQGYAYYIVMEGVTPTRDGKQEVYFACPEENENEDAIPDGGAGGYVRKLYHVVNMKYMKGECQQKEDDGVLPPTYMGCYCDNYCNPGNVDGKEGRDLPTRLPDYLNPNDCLTEATKQGFRYAGLQFGIECWAGQDSPQRLKREESECSLKCPGDLSMFCGGADRNSVYQLNGSEEAKAKADAEAKRKEEEAKAKAEAEAKENAGKIPDYLAYVGCYEFCVGGCRDGRDDLPITIGTDVPSRCFAFAYRYRHRGFKYVGLADGGDCSTGTTAPQREKRPDSECNAQCTQDEELACGAVNRISVYQIYEDAETREKAQEEAKAKEEAERIAREEAEAARIAKEEAEKIAQQEAEEARIAQEEEERQKREEEEAAAQAAALAELEAQIEADRLAKEEAQRKAEEEHAALLAAQAEADEKKRLAEEAAAKAQAEVDALKKMLEEALAAEAKRAEEEAERLAQEAAEREAAAIAAAEAAAAKEEADRIAKEKAEAEAAAQAEAERLAKEKAEQEAAEAAANKTFVWSVLEEKQQCKNKKTMKRVTTEQACMEQVLATSSGCGEQKYFQFYAKYRWCHCCINTDSSHHFYLAIYKITEEVEEPPPPMCCKAMTKQCEACSQGVSVEEYCQQNPGKYDCPSEAVLPDRAACETECRTKMQTIRFISAGSADAFLEKCVTDCLENPDVPGEPAVEPTYAEFKKGAKCTERFKLDSNAIDSAKTCMEATLADKVNCGTQKYFIWYADYDWCSCCIDSESYVHWAYDMYEIDNKKPEEPVVEPEEPEEEEESPIKRLGSTEAVVYNSDTICTYSSKVTEASVSSFDDCRRRSILAGREKCPTDFFIYGGSTVLGVDMRMCLCCKTEKETIPLPAWFHVYKIIPKGSTLELPEQDNIFDNIVDGAQDAVDTVVDGANAAVDAVVDGANAVVDGVVDGANAIADGISNTVDSFTDLLPDWSFWRRRRRLAGIGVTEANSNSDTESTLEIAYKLRKRDEYCENYKKVTASDEFVTLEVCAQITLQGNYCNYGKGYFIHQGDADGARCYCCSTQEAMTKTVEAEGWNIYQALYRGVETGNYQYKTVDYFRSMHGFYPDTGIAASYGRTIIMRLINDYPKRMESIDQLAGFIQDTYPDSIGFTFHPDYFNDDSQRHAYYIMRNELRSDKSKSWPLFYWVEKIALEKPDYAVTTVKCYNFEVPSYTGGQCVSAGMSTLFRKYEDKTLVQCHDLCANNGKCGGFQFKDGICQEFVRLIYVNCNAKIPQMTEVWDKREQLDCTTQEVCPVNCMGEWSKWSDCSEECDSGEQTQTFRINLPKKGIGSDCEAENGATRTRLCNTEACQQDCTGQWSDFGACSNDCNGGTQQAIFVVTHHNSEQGKICPGEEVEQCNGGLCTNYRGFQRTTKSGKTCQAWNTQTPQRHFNTPEKKQGFGLEDNYCRNPDGADSIWCYTTDPQTRWEYCEPLQNAFVYERECNTQPCPRDCEGFWSDWTDCSRECDSGYQASSYVILNDKVGDGKACSNEHGELKERVCNTEVCPKDCKGHWGYWNACSKVCDAGVQISFFEITQQKVGIGADCLPGNEEHCSGEKCAGYRGFQTETVSGKICQNWDTNYPHHTEQIMKNAEEYGLEENYCRNPDGEQSIWCFTTDPDVRWEYCEPIVNSVETCSGQACSGYRGLQDTTKNGLTCQAWTVQEPHEHRNTPIIKPDEGLQGNYCRNPDGELSIWCYTTDPNTRWDYCQPKEIDQNSLTKERACNTHHCPIDCIGDWDEWSECTKECGGGYQTQTYNVIEQQHGSGISCEADDLTQRTRKCNSQVCPRNCVGEWSDFTSCSKVCGGGTQSKVYSITHHRAGTGTACAAAEGDTETRDCNTDACSADCEGSWSDWSTCSEDCDSGTQTQTYTITQNAVGSGSGCEAAHNAQRSQACNTHACPADCSGTWSAWSSCSATCGGGTQTSTFSIESSLIGTGDSCEAFHNEQRTKSCNTHLCPVDCQGSWKDFGTCSAKCGDGKQAQVFEKTQLKVSTGAECEAAHNELRQLDCNLGTCSLDCEGEWTEWSECSKTCGSGTQQQVFHVSQGYSGNGGQCEANHLQVRDRFCNTHACPENCEGSWSDWSQCSTPCGPGTQTRTYTVTKQKVGTGNECPYEHNWEILQHCQLQVCPKDCDGEWSEWEACSLPCGGGYQTQVYKIAHHSVGGGKGCEAIHNMQRQRFCNTQNCPQDCSGHWGPWSECSATCGVGSMSQSWVVTTPKLGEGEDCEFSAEWEIKKTKVCDSGLICPQNCEGEWSQWSMCTCKKGENPSQEQIYVHTQQPIGTGTDCDIPAGTKRTRFCKKNDCDQDCKGSWGPWSECSKKCDTGSQWSAFNVEQSKVGDGKECEAEHGKRRTQFCNEDSCPEDPNGPTCCPENTAECLACKGGVTIKEFCKYKPDTDGCENAAETTSPEKCCTAITASCVACQFGIPVSEICKMKADLDGCNEEEPMSANCCTDKTVECTACNLGLTPEEYCDKMPDRLGCSEFTVDQISGILKQNAETTTTTSGQDPTQTCCKAISAKCLACQARVTEEEFCIIKPKTFGCPDKDEDKKPAEAEENAECCRDVTAECLACQTGMTAKEYCQWKPNTPGCQPCCNLMIARCLACKAGWTEEEYCDAAPTTIGCPGASAMTPAEGENAECCELPIAKCLACKNKVTVDDYCVYRPKTLGCPGASTTESSGGLTNANVVGEAGTVAQEICCGIPTAKCLACQNDVKEIEYCEVMPKTVGCDVIIAAQKSLDKNFKAPEEPKKNCLIEDFSLGIDNPLGNIFSGDILCQDGMRLKALLSSAAIGLALLLAA